MKQLGWLLLLPLATYIALCIYLYLIQRSMLYYPSPPTDSKHAVPLFLSNDDNTVKIWHVERDSDQALIYFGGNAEDVSLSIQHLKHLYPNHSLYLTNYRGYGGSTGKPSEKALLSDAKVLYDSIDDRYAEITVKGRSLGTGVAVHLASSRPVDKLILVTPFDSMARVALHYYPYLPVNLLMHDRYESFRHAESITVPTLFLIAEHDEIIPRENSDSLAAKLDPNATKVAVIRGTNHNDIGASPDYERAIQDFLLANDNKQQ